MLFYFIAYEARPAIERNKCCITIDVLFYFTEDVVSCAIKYNNVRAARACRIVAELISFYCTWYHALTYGQFH